MKKNYILFAILILSLATTAFADVKIKSKQTMSGQSYENTTYIKGKRQRTETMSGMMINITQCDLHRGVQINPNTKTYIINQYETETTAATKPTNVKSDGVVRAGGTVTTTVTVKDTGERKQMFGFQAKHLIITMETVSSPDACNKNNSKMQMDGWYIDAEFVLDCDTNQYRSYNPQTAKGGCQDKYSMKQNGTAKRGYPVYEKMTMFDENGKESMSIVNEVVELSKATLNAELFDVPQGYKEVSDASQMYAASNYGNMSSSSSSTSNSPSMSLPNTGKSTSSGMNMPTTSSANSAVGPKKAGTVRIGVSVKAGSVGEGITSADLAAAVQNTLSEYLKGTKVEIVVLDAKLQTLLENEAKQKDCDFVLTATVSHKKGGGGFGGMLGQAIAQGVGRTGIGHTGSTVGNVAGQVATQSIVSAGQASANVKPKDEITLDISMKQTSGAAVLTKQFKAKAKSAGEDIISPVVEQAAEAIVSSAK
ncbi:MAG TPA: DUF4412 domain-containing protein [Pyrinomonadaceae bacterium]|nr:DUF4412 domain-containing protein [Pyrinomonadaceae bacterium]